MSGEERFGDGRRHARDAALARYAWPDDDALAAEVVGEGRPLIAVGLLPHANEPLGSAFATSARGYPGHPGSIALVGPIDPPPRSHRFPMPCDPVTFVAQGYIQPPQEQAEFSHCPHPATPAQHRAAEFRERLSELQPDIVVLVHNAPCARSPYLYANSPWPAVERRLQADLSGEFPDWTPPPDATWTYQIGARTFSYFPCNRIGVAGTESAGIYIERELGVPTLTVELPMFNWGSLQQVRLEFRRTLGQWIADGGAHGGDRPGLIRNVARLLAGHEVTMLPPATSSRIVWSVLDGLRESLD